MNSKLNCHTLYKSLKLSRRNENHLSKSHQWTLLYLRRAFWWLSMPRNILEFVQACPVDAKTKEQNPASPSNLQQLPVPCWSWTHIMSWTCHHKFSHFMRARTHYSPSWTSSPSPSTSSPSLVSPLPAPLPSTPPATSTITQNPRISLHVSLDVNVYGISHSINPRHLPAACLPPAPQVFHTSSSIPAQAFHSPTLLCIKSSTGRMRS